MRLKLESEISRLNDLNQQLQEQLEKCLSKLQKKRGSNSPESDAKKELCRKDSLIGQLISQNRELLAAKFRLESELSTQRSIADESRCRLEMLENALTRDTLEKRRLVRQQSVSTAQNGNKTPATEKPGPELPFHHSFYHQTQFDTDDGISSDSESPTTVHSLIRQLQEKERQIMQLEADVIRWEEKYLEETVFRQLAIDTVSIPKDAKIAALIQNSADNDRLLANSRLEKLTLLKELHGANERCNQLEAQVKSLQADMAEKDSLIQILQRHTSLSRANSISSLIAAAAAAVASSSTSSSCVTSPHQSPQQQHRRTTPGPAPFNHILANCNVLHGAESVESAGVLGGSKTSSRQSSQSSVERPVVVVTGVNNVAGPLSSLSNSTPPATAYFGVLTDEHHNILNMDDLLANYGPANVQQCFWQV
jgi:angiomotin